MSSRHVLPLAAALLAAASLAPADTITSTGAGGSWFNGATWVGGVVPGPQDDVVIAGPVTVGGVAACRGVEVGAAGSVNGEIVAPPRILRVSGALANFGSVGAVNSIYLDVELGGDLHNAGFWGPVRTRFIGSQARRLSQTPDHRLSTDLAYAPGASGDLRATTPLTLSGVVDLSSGRLVLDPACPVTLDAASFRGNMIAGGNELRFVSWSYLNQSDIDDVVFVGEAKASFGVTVTTRLVVTHTLRNERNLGGGSVTVEGDLVNQGLIEHDHYSFLVRVTGDIENNGDIRCPTLELMGVGAVHHLSMDADGVINSPVFLPEFQAATIVADTPVRFGDGLALGAGALILQPAASLEFVGRGGLGSGTVLAGGNHIDMHGSGSIGGVTIDNGVLGGQITFAGTSRFTGGLVVTGTAESGGWSGADITVEGTLHNDGTIHDGDHPLRIVASGDLINRGTFAISRMVLAGTADQAVATGPAGLAVPEFVIESGLDAADYQWFRDGQPLDGETGADLVLSMVDAGDHGRYQCEADGRLSRNITIAESAGPAGVAGPFAPIAGAGIQPNPFHPATRIAFRLDASSRVSLEVYDLSGRSVASLAADRPMPPGEHHLDWNAGGLPAGTYYIRLRAGNLSWNRKCTLLR